MKKEESEITFENLKNSKKMSSSQSKRLTSRYMAICIINAFGTYNYGLKIYKTNKEKLINIICEYCSQREIWRQWHEMYQSYITPTYWTTKRNLRDLAGYSITAIHKLAEIDLNPNKFRHETNVKHEFIYSSRELNNYISEQYKLFRYIQDQD